MLCYAMLKMFTTWGPRHNILPPVVALSSTQLLKQGLLTVILFLDVSNEEWHYFIWNIRMPLRYSMDPFLPFTILLSCNIIIIYKMVRVKKKRVKKFGKEEEENIYGCIPMMLGINKLFSLKFNTKQ